VRQRFPSGLVENVHFFTTDKQGRLLAATSGGLFRLDPPDNPGPAMATK
jgi:hypothetical protein